jgi:hypothetical protein
MEFKEAYKKGKRIKCKDWYNTINFYCDKNGILINDSKPIIIPSRFANEDIMANDCDVVEKVKIGEWYVHWENQLVDYDRLEQAKELLKERICSLEGYKDLEDE